MSETQSYRWVPDASAWGEDVTPDEHELLCALAQQYCDLNEGGVYFMGDDEDGNDVRYIPEIIVCAEGSTPGLCALGINGNWYRVAPRNVPEGVAHLLNEAWQHACENLEVS